MRAALKSIGAYIPEKVLTNKDFESIVDTTDEWIVKRTGIKERHIAAIDESTSDLGAKAAKLAIQRAGLKTNDIDMIVCATISPEFMCMPSTACMIASKLGRTNVTAFDITAACTGFIYAMSIAKAFIESGMKKNVLIVGAEKLSSIVDYSDRTTCVLFGDGAGAAVISATRKRSEAITDIHVSADGDYSDLLMTPGCHSKNSISHENSDDGKACTIKMKGNETFKIAVRTLTSDVVNILNDNNIDASDIKYFIPHQANYRIIKAVGDILKMNKDQIALTVEKYGNTSSASIPMAMNDLWESGKLQPGDMMLLDAFGGGLTWGSALLPFSGKAFN